MDKIYFVTSNQSKFNEYKERFFAVGYELIQQDANLDEGRSMKIKDVIDLKIEQAKKLLPSKKIIVDDRGFFVDGLKGFPGPYVKLALSTVGIEGIIKLLADNPNRKASFLTGVAYFDGNEIHYFIEEEVGFITDSIKGDNIRGWTDILKIYGYPGVSSTKSLAQYSDAEWDSYNTMITKEDQLQKLLDFLKN